MATDSYEIDDTNTVPDWASGVDPTPATDDTQIETPQTFESGPEPDAGTGGRSRRGRKNAETPARAGGRRRAGALRGTTVEQRKAVERTVAVADLDDGELSLLGFAAGLADAGDVIEVTLASLGAEERCVAVLGLILQVSQAEPMAAGAIAVGASAETYGLGAAWAALRHLSTGLPASIPSNPVEAGMAFAAAAQAIGGQTSETLGGLLRLLGADLNA